ncbi:MAG: hypothetical protein MHMPM18_000477 [Marteilia pararefringens]
MQVISLQLKLGPKKLTTDSTDFLQITDRISEQIISDGHALVEFEDLNKTFILMMETDDLKRKFQNLTWIQIDSRNNDYIKDICEKDFFPTSDWLQQSSSSIKAEFFLSFQRLIGKLSEESFVRFGQAKIYLPRDEFIKLDDTLTEKDLNIIIEDRILMWNRQLRNILNNVEQNYSTSHKENLRDELKLWDQVAENIKNVLEQLNSDCVRNTISILEKSNSQSYQYFKTNIKLFESYRSEIKENQKCVAILSESLLELENIEDIGSLTEIFKRLIMSLYFMIRNSKHYSKRDRIVKLFKQLCATVIESCSKHISVTDILNTDVDNALEKLDKILQICKKFIEDFDEFNILHSTLLPGEEKLPKAPIFAQLDVFIQRLKDLCEVCESKKSFLGVAENNLSRSILIGFGDCLEIIKNFDIIQMIMRGSLEDLKLVENSAFETKSCTWVESFSKFRKTLKDVEGIIQNIINQSFQKLKSIEIGIFILNLFSNLNEREPIKRSVDRAGMEIINMVNIEMDKIEISIENIAISHQNSDIPFSAYEIIYLNNLRQKLRSIFSHVDSTSFLKNTGQALESKSVYERIDSRIDSILNERKTEIANKFSSFDLKELDKCVMRINIEAMHFSPNFDDLFKDMSEREKKLFKDQSILLLKKLNPGIHKIKWADSELIEIFYREIVSNSEQIYLEELNQNLGNNISNIFSKSFNVLNTEWSNESDDDILKISISVMFNDRSFLTDPTKFNIISAIEKLIYSLVELITGFNKFGSDFIADNEQNTNDILHSIDCDMIRNHIMTISDHIDKRFGPVDEYLEEWQQYVWIFDKINLDEIRFSDDLEMLENLNIKYFNMKLDDIITTSSQIQMTDSAVDLPCFQVLLSTIKDKMVSKLIDNQNIYVDSMKELIVYMNSEFSSFLNHIKSVIDEDLSDLDTFKKISGSITQIEDKYKELSNKMRSNESLISLYEFYNPQGREFQKHKSNLKSKRIAIESDIDSICDKLQNSPLFEYDVDENDSIKLIDELKGTFNSINNEIYFYEECSKFIELDPLNLDLYNNSNRVFIIKSIT